MRSYSAATYEGLAAVWPHLGEDPTMGPYAEQINAMPKYVASRTLTGPLEWNATLIEGEVAQAVPALKQKHTGNLIVSGCGELAHTLATDGLVDEYWFWVNPHLCAGRTADPQRSRPDPPATGHGHTVPIRRHLGALPAGRGLRGRIHGKDDRVRRRTGPRPGPAA